MYGTLILLIVSSIDLSLSTSTKVNQKCAELLGLFPGGSDKNEFPYLGRLTQEDKQNVACVASLISEKYAIVPAHCTKSNTLKIVRFGSTGINLSKLESQEQEIRIARFITNPNYKTPLNYNDIALLELETEVVINEAVKPICLNSDKEITNGNLLLTSFAHDLESGKSTDLHKIAVTKISFEECKKFYKNTPPRKLPHGLDGDTQICFEEAEQGVIGGSIVDIEINTLYGIASFGQRIGPQVYTNIAPYVDWIEAIVWPS